MHFLRLTAAAAAILTVCPLLQAIPASAETEASAETFIEPVYEPDQAYAGALHLSVTGEIPSWIRIHQHSPEAESLLVYYAELPAKPDHYVLQLEPGDYTCEMIASPLTDGALPLITRQDFTVMNPDFSEKFDFNDYQLDVSFTLIGKDSVPAVQTSELQKALKDGRRLLSQTMQFSYYENRLTGDYDGDGRVRATDASDVLTEFSLALAGFGENPNSTKEQVYACDMNGNGKLEASDASAILTFFTLGLSGFEPDWDAVLNP